MGLSLILLAFDGRGKVCFSLRRARKARCASNIKIQSPWGFRDQDSENNLRN